MGPSLRSNIMSLGSLCHRILWFCLVQSQNSVCLYDGTVTLFGQKRSYHWKRSFDFVLAIVESPWRQQVKSDYSLLEAFAICKYLEVLDTPCAE